jgi:exopolyphosphatase/guanosine-5'-triphosphate,3'-diphosphate pyrophosphatase
MGETPSPGRSQNRVESSKVHCCRELAQSYRSEWPHLEQVERLSSALFQVLQPVHGLTGEEGDLLSCAALLHDIGISIDYRDHHKHSMRLILQCPLPALSAGEKERVALIARYHRKANPYQKHEAFASLPVEAQRRVSQLASILRIADGLDRAHEGAVAGIGAHFTPPDRWTIGIWGPGDLTYAAWGADRKSILFEELHSVDVVFEPRRRGEV